MIIRNEATLVVLGRSVRASARHVSDSLGLDPTDWGEPGDSDISAMRPRPWKDGRTREHAMWHLRVDDDGASHDGSGFASLRALVTLLTPRAAAVQALDRDDDYEVRIDWAGFSSSGQGGFVLEPDLARTIGALGIPLFGTAYLSEEDDARRPGQEDR